MMSALRDVPHLRQIVVLQPVAPVSLIGRLLVGVHQAGKLIARHALACRVFLRANREGFHESIISHGTHLRDRFGLCSTRVRCFYRDRLRSERFPSVRKQNLIFHLSALYELISFGRNTIAAIPAATHTSVPRVEVIVLGEGPRALLTAAAA